MGSFASLGGRGIGSGIRGAGGGSTAGPRLPRFPLTGGGGGNPGITQLVGGITGQSAPPPGTVGGTGGGSGGGGGGGSTPHVVTNTAQPDPNLTLLTKQFQDRLKKLGERPAGDDTYTQRAISRTRGAIADQAAGAQEAATADAAARGIVGGGTDVARRNSIEDAARRRGDNAAAGIALDRVRDEEQMGFARDQMENQFLLGGAGIMEAPARLGLSQQQLALQQALGFGNLDLGRAGLDLQRDQFSQGRQDNQMSMIMALMRLYPQMFGASA